MTFHKKQNSRIYQRRKNVRINWLAFCKWLVKVRLSRVQISHFFLLANISFWEVISTQIESPSDPTLYFLKPLNEMHFMCSCLAVKTPQCSLTTSGCLDPVGIYEHCPFGYYRYVISLADLHFSIKIQMTYVLCKITALECLDKMWHR